MSTHTQGRLHAFTPYADHELRDEAGNLVAVVPRYGMTVNARRLAACWNRLKPFTTEQIEDCGYDLFSEQQPQFDRLAAELSATKQQRDELLEALKWTMTMDADQDEDGWEERVHAVIARATGGAA